jgi:cytochrome c peroxidase
MTQLDLSDAEVADLVAFLNALTDPAVIQRLSDVPSSVPSGLPVDP